MRVLSHLPDGTFHHATLARHLLFYKFLLQAATDSLPVVLTPGLLEALFGNNLAESWVWLLVQAPFSDPGLGSEKKANIVWFTRGRPLGFYSSWPTFTLTLHMLVWLSAD